MNEDNTICHTPATGQSGVTQQQYNTPEQGHVCSCVLNIGGVFIDCKYMYEILIFFTWNQFVGMAPVVQQNYASQAPVDRASSKT